jgi:hypothetical protein
MEKFDEIVASHHTLAKLEARNGYSVLIGLDKILGIGNTSLLSRDLLLALKNKNIRYLYQAKAQSSWGFITNQWRTK